MLTTHPAGDDGGPGRQWGPMAKWVGPADPALRTGQRVVTLT